MKRVEKDGQQGDPVVEHSPQPIEQREDDRCPCEDAPHFGGANPIEPHPMQPDQHHRIDVDVEVFEGPRDAAPLERVGHVQIVIGVVAHRGETPGGNRPGNEADDEHNSQPHIGSGKEPARPIAIVPCGGVSSRPAVLEA